MGRAMESLLSTGWVAHLYYIAKLSGFATDYTD
jgi:hypothetical protein